MQEGRLRYPEHYNFTNRIMDLNFYTNFKQRYDSIIEEATRIGGKSFTHLLNEFVWNDDMIDYARALILILEASIGLVQKQFWQS
ncbi:hypothetical protein KY290_000687 [Solanum tuberosum]|uniref:Uncharacterized protein n=1 Tax=Solanum tuberosum TaxID=4113 RepID=A0ABQ7WK10_SOLTU|nr:hypothetical protein KY289_000749 [Solanum tuberosum]KAH0781089.1 hypothetical protein KY290_000687 [Solanum tuberosum]